MEQLVILYFAFSCSRLVTYTTTSYFPGPTSIRYVSIVPMTMSHSFDTSHLLLKRTELLKDSINTETDSSQVSELSEILKS
jgi:hypothetical protein